MEFSPKVTPSVTTSHIHDMDKCVHIIHRKYEHGFEWWKEYNEKTRMIFFHNNRGEAYIKKSDGTFYSDCLGLTYER